MHRQNILTFSNFNDTSNIQLSTNVQINWLLKNPAPKMMNSKRGSCCGVMCFWKAELRRLDVGNLTIRLWYRKIRCHQWSCNGKRPNSSEDNCISCRVPPPANLRENVCEASQLLYPPSYRQPRLHWRNSRWAELVWTLDTCKSRLVPPDCHWKWGPDIGLRCLQRWPPWFWPNWHRVAANHKTFEVHPTGVDELLLTWLSSRQHRVARE